MIEISRLLALQFRSVCRRLGVRASTNANPTVCFAADADGLRIRVLGRDVALEHVLPGEFAKCAFNLPLSALGEVGSTTRSPVTFTPLSSGAVRLIWSSGPIPRQLDVDLAAPPLGEFPQLPAHLVPNPSTLHTALRHAVATADRETSTRYALHTIKLDGTNGRIVTTDGRQALVQTGYTFPWDGDVLLPASKVFDAVELIQEDPITVGRLGDWVALTFGRWIVYSRHDAEARFPKVDSVLGRPASARATLNLSETDAEFLGRSLDVMPTECQVSCGVTIDLNGNIAVRSRADHQSPPTEVVLSNSSYSGAALRTSCDRKFLGRALKLGFRSLYFSGPESPLYCDDGLRHYLWMSLPSTSVVLPAENAQRVESPTATGRTCPIHSNRRHHMPRSTFDQAARPISAQTDTATEEGATAPRTVELRRKKRRVQQAAATSTLDQAVAVRDALRDALAKSRELVRALKRHNRQSRLVATTLQSLKELQAVA